MLNTIVETALRTLFAYGLVLFLARIMGRKLITQLTFFDFVVGVTLGSVTANLAIGKNATPTVSTTVLITLTILAVSTGYLVLKSKWIRKLFHSESIVLIENGKMVDQNLKKLRLTIDDFTMLLREKNVFNLGDVEFALMEHDGKISVEKKSQKQPLTPSDLNIPTTYKGLTKDLIIDGAVQIENLQDARLDNKWLLDQLKKQDIHDPKEVFYAGLDTTGNLYVSKRQKDTNRTREKHGKYGIE